MKNDNNLVQMNKQILDVLKESAGSYKSKNPKAGKHSLEARNLTEKRRKLDKPTTARLRIKTAELDQSKEVRRGWEWTLNCKEETMRTEGSIHCHKKKDLSIRNGKSINKRVREFYKDIYSLDTMLEEPENLQHEYYGFQDILQKKVEHALK